MSLGKLLRKGPVMSSRRMNSKKAHRKCRQMTLESLESRQLLYAPTDPYFDNDGNNTSDSYQWYLGRNDNVTAGNAKGINVSAAWNELIIGDGFPRETLPPPLASLG